MANEQTQDRRIESATAEALRRAFEQTGWSIKQWSRVSNLPYATTHAIACGSRDVLTSTADRLARALGYELVLKPIRRKAKA